MNRRTFLMSAAVSAALFFTGCKGEDKKPEAEGATAAHQCACPEGQCGCAECKGGDTASCTCAAPSDAGGTGSTGGAESTGGAGQ